MKSASGYVGAGKLHYACYYVQSAWHANNFVNMVHYYPLIVEAAIEFKRFVRQYLAEYKGEKYSESESARTCELADGYRLEYHVDGKLYCMKKGETLKERLETLSKHCYKPEIVSLNN